MFLYLSKLLPLLILPLGLVCLLIVASLLLHRHKRTQRGLLLAALALLIVAGNGRVARSLVQSLEWQYLPPADLDDVRVAVVLGGGGRAHEYPRAIAEMNEGGDRMLYAAWLYQQGLVDHLILSGGAIDFLGGNKPEAQGMAEVLAIMGVPPEAMWLEAEARNTYENALYVKEILEDKGIDRVVLITSAQHMPRSAAIFRKQGIDFIPAPTDYQVSRPEFVRSSSADLGAFVLGLLPTSSALEDTASALREYLGILIYRLRGWL